MKMVNTTKSREGEGITFDRNMLIYDNESIGRKY